MKRLIQNMVKLWVGRDFKYEIEQMQIHRLYRKWYFSRIEDAKNMMKTPDFSPKIRDFLIKMQG